MALVTFFLFLVVSHFLLMQVFRLTTYHRYFARALPLLVAYSGLVGWLMYRWGLHSFFLWQLALSGLWLFAIARRNNRQGQVMLELAGSNADSVRAIAQSIGNTKHYYVYSSFTYLVVLSAAFLWAYNT